MRIKEVELTPEMRARLAAYLPITESGQFDYVPVVYRELPSTVQPVFQLVPVDGVDKLLMDDEYATDFEVDEKRRVRKLSMKKGGLALAACRRGVKGWKNYVDPRTGHEAAFNEDLRCLPEALLYELGGAVLKRVRAQLADEEVNSLS